MGYPFLRCLSPVGFADFYIMEEQWKPIPVTDGCYMVSNLGRVKSLPKSTMRKNGTKITTNGRFLKSVKDNKGYLRIAISYNGLSHRFKIHRLVAQMFIPNPKRKPQVNHKNGIKTDNRVENLEWNTCAENINHAEKLGLRNHLVGKDKPQSKLTEDDVRYIKLNRGVISGRKLAEKFKVNRSTIINIYANKIWRHV